MGVKKTEEVSVAAVNEDEGPVVVKLTIPRELYAEYAELAAKQEVTPAELMIHRLDRCRTHTSLRSIYFPTSQVLQLEALLQKRPIQTPEQVLALVRSAFSVTVGDLPPIPISLQQSKRLHLGTVSGQTVHDHVARIVQGAIAKATGA